ncbi:hypothetical protein B0T18DRAFT_426065 [Schizothecium vesticola]|uniref:Uncharacterized protein n=1 Tax=Schizothecium vesticola TaxID=314040 RepID=A0AA40KA02_9PEZI|nr:hypothetical protein B0T18DRAFT_426065 [Schizothecium vesticola]
MVDLIPTSFSTGAVSIGDTIRAHDFGKGPLVCALAPAFGRLNKDAMHTMTWDVPVVRRSNELYARQDMLEQQYLECFKPSGGAVDAAGVQEVRSWLQGFTCGKRNLDNIDLVGDVLAKMISGVSATFKEMEKGDPNTWNFAREQPLLDIGLFRLKLSTFGSRGIVGECTLQMFEPDCLAIDNMSPADRKDAIDTADTLFDYP